MSQNDIVKTPFYRVLGLSSGATPKPQEARVVQSTITNDPLNTLRVLSSSSTLFEVQPGMQQLPVLPTAAVSTLGTHSSVSRLGPRGLLLADSLPCSPALTTLERRPLASPAQMFASIHTWPLRAMKMQMDDPAVLVQNNQEKLLNSSVKKQVLSPTNRPEAGATGPDSNGCSSGEQQEEDMALLAALVDTFSLDLQLPPSKGSSPGPDRITLSASLREKLAVPPHVNYTFADSLTGGSGVGGTGRGRALPWREDFIPAVPPTFIPAKEGVVLPAPELSAPPPPSSDSPPTNTSSSLTTTTTSSSSGADSGGGGSGGNGRGPVRFAAFRPKYKLEVILNEEEEDEEYAVSGFVTEMEEVALREGAPLSSQQQHQHQQQQQQQTHGAAPARSLCSSKPLPAAEVTRRPPGGAGDVQSSSASTAAVTTMSSDEDLDSLLAADSFSEQSLFPLSRPATSRAPAATGTGTLSGYKWASTEALPDSEYEALRPHLALTFPFELDFFQKQAVMRLERRECVFVAAHTSAGKTVVAEYAIAMAKKHMSRTIYTSPIKALSNQKYRDFVEKFGSDVGLITGDMSINPDASCLIMTTEILRSMLYRGSDVVRDIEWVIFDEVHYVNDPERGVVWEEVIIMLPERINLIFLSATTPNTIEFSDWIGRTKRRKVYVTSTSKRPVPLQHFFFHDEEVYPLMTSDGRFQPAAIQAAVARVKQKSMVKEKTAENAAMGMQRANEKSAIAAQNRGGSVSKGGRGGGKPGSGGGGGGGGGGKGMAAGRGVGGKGGGAVSGGKAQWLSLIRLLFNGGRREAGGLAAVDFGEASTIRKAKSSSGKMGSLGGKQRQEKYDRLPDYIKEQVSRKEYAQMDIRMDTALPTSAADFEDQGGAPEDDAEVGLLPVVVFCFSKKKCDEIIDFLKSMDFLTAKEKAEVKKLMAKVTNRLNPDDARLPQIARMTDLLTRGLAVHHGGLLPVLKEAVEILFSQSLVRVLLATETFAMGVNMPARAVVFNGFRKNDGKEFRNLLPGEYTQMAGRAGRRGKDSVGTVILANFSDIPEHAEVAFKTLLTGTATKLTSQFRLSYNMILNLLRVNDLSVEDMIKRSFSEFHIQRQMAKHDLGSKLKQLQAVVSLLEQRKEASWLLGAGAGAGAGAPSAALHDTEQFYAKYMSTTSLLTSQLTFAMHVAGSAGVRDLLSAGRFLLVHQVPASSSSPGANVKTTAAPCLGVVLTDPIGCFSDDERESKALIAAALKKAEGAIVPAKGKSLGVGLMGLGLESTKTGLGSSSSSAADDTLALTDLYVWVLVLVPRRVGMGTGEDCASTAVVKVSLEHISMVFEAQAAAEGLSSSAHLLGLPPPSAESAPSSDPAAMMTAAAASSSFGGMKMKMKTKGDEEEMFGGGGKSKNAKKGAKKGAGSGGTSQALSPEDSRAALRLQLFDFMLELAEASRTDAVTAAVAVLDVSVAIKHREFEFAASCSKHGQRARELLVQFDCWRLYLNSFVEQQAAIDMPEAVGSNSYVQQQDEFLASFLLEHRLFCAKEKIHLLQHYSSSASLALFPDFQQRMRVLHHLNYIEEGPQEQHGACDDLTSSTVSLKGRVACEMNTCDELLATEVLFQNILDPLNPPEIAALLSAFVFQENNGENCVLTTRLEEARTQVNDLHAKLRLLQKGLGVKLLDSGPGKTGVNFGLAAVVYEWARGRSFMSIARMTLTHEGSVVRTMTRLDELCADFRNAARVVGNPSLYRKMEATSQCIKRDIVFAASLYVS